MSTVGWAVGMVAGVGLAATWVAREVKALNLAGYGPSGERSGRDSYGVPLDVDDDTD